MGSIRLEDLPNYTYADYRNWEGRWELIHGVAYAMSPSPVLVHQNLTKAIAFELDTALDSCPDCVAVLALDWKIDDSTVLCPDNAVVCRLSPDSDYIDKPPVMVFEVLSPATKHKDRTVKFALYQEQGVVYYIMVDPRGLFAEIYRLQGGRYRLVCEIGTDRFDFDLGECRIAFEFGKIFRG